MRIGGSGRVKRGAEIETRKGRSVRVHFEDASQRPPRNIGDCGDRKDIAGIIGGDHTCRRLVPDV